MLSRSQQYYINNKEEIKQKALQYYYNNKEARQKYNNEYWEEHKHKYAEIRKKDTNYKLKEIQNIVENMKRFHFHHTLIQTKHIKVL